MRFRNYSTAGLCLLCALMLIALIMAGGCAKPKAPPPSGAPGKPAKTPPTQRPYTIKGKTYHPIQSASGFTETGLASWYGPNFHGKRTSNGETYDMEAMTAAHKTLPMNTWVVVKNLDNGKVTKARINDRGPFVDGRVIDLSKAAARDAGVIGPGTARVQVTALGYRRMGSGGKVVYQKPASYQTGVFTVQVGAFTVKNNADRLAEKLRPKWGEVAVVRYDRGDQVFHRVRVGKAHDLKAAAALQAKLRRAGFAKAFAVAK